MCTVNLYENSFITIAATNAPSCKEGFLQPTGATQREFRVKPKPSDASLGPGHFGLRETFTTELSRNDMVPEPLHKRVWCMQKWLLPQRLLSFE